MDLSTVTSLRPARTRADLVLAPGEGLLGGGSWLFSTPQPHLSGLVDLTALGWPALETGTDGGLRIAATCTLAELVAADPHPLVRPCAEALLLSPQVRTLATVGGNLCLALPAGAMIALAVVLDATAVVWTPDGGERLLPAADLVAGVQRTTLAPGEVLRAVDLPASALTAPTAHRRISLTARGRTAALVLARRDDVGPRAGTTVVVTGSTTRPVVLGPDEPDADRARLDELDLWYADPHGPVDWRRAMTLRLVDQVRAELAGGRG